MSPFWGDPNAPSIGMACNIYNDVNAVAGLLEMSSQYFDEMVFFHAGPQGALSNDGTIELLEKWKVKVVYGKIDEGFGVVRTVAVRSCKTAWVMILDADERFHPRAPVILPHGSGNDIHVQHFHDCYDQGALLRRLIQYPEIDAIESVRRHWHDFSWQRPTQNWHQIADLQRRIVRNVEHVCYRSEVRMHEQLIDTRTGRGPRAHSANGYRGIFHDHYHCFFKAMEPEQRAHDVQIYDAIHEGRIPPVEGA